MSIPYKTSGWRLCANPDYLDLSAQSAFLNHEDCIRNIAGELTIPLNAYALLPIVEAGLIDPNDFPIIRLIMQIHKRGGLRKAAEVTEKLRPAALGYEPARPMFPHQEVAWTAARILPHIGLLLDMGTGKTQVAIDAASYSLQKGKVERVYVICLSPIRNQWVGQIRELATFKPDDVALVANNPPYHTGLRKRGMTNANYRRSQVRRGATCRKRLHRGRRRAHRQRTHPPPARRNQPDEPDHSVPPRDR